VRALSGGFPGVTVFAEVSFSVEPGEIALIVGANGSGKSALLATLQGLLEASAGSIILDGAAVETLPPEVRAARGMILLSDRRWLWSEMTVDQHLRAGAFRAEARPGWRGRAAGFRGFFTSLSLAGRARPRQLSGGARQELALARFGMALPRIWLLDDPLSGLDSAAAARALDWVRDAGRAGASILLTGQHIREFLGVATKAMFLEGGRLSPLSAGVAGLEDPRVRKLL
jgi:branched-chain amino acid transport system ATP-binding protein